MNLDIIWNNLDFFVHVIITMLIYQQITGHIFAKRWLIIVPTVLRILFLIVPPIAYFSTLLFLVAYSLVKNRYNNRLLDVFYGLFPVIVESLFSRLLIYYFFPTIGINDILNNQNYFCGLISELLVFPTYYFLMKSLKVDFKNLHKGFLKDFSKIFIFLADISMLLYFVGLQILLLFDRHIPYAMMGRKYLIAIYGILFLVMLVYINGDFNEKLEQEILLQKDRQINDLTAYSKQIEYLYNEIRSFRHDYLGILSSLKSGIVNKDIEAIETVYKNVLSKTEHRVQGERYEIANLINVKNDAIKGLLFSKILEAQSQGIEIHLEVFEPFNTPNIELLDFITILSILLENAIEAVQPNTNQKVVVALITGEPQVVIIENSIGIEKVDVINIYKRGFSTKGESRGIGLANAKRILEKYPNCSLRTESGGYKFRQILTSK
ncbi:MAG: GHKL domain-containing protein [Streptococcus orisratti]|uniref:sensor histidine kinase n=1 Tax=Streptococcus orisratti TaxID=114652 RepID=UPI0023535D2E|nr:GHKL domain-containing protein [Streptococcus orisratti]MCI7678125.1 GHKL domain-containing protein [Streptococcus orisratti]